MMGTARLILMGAMLAAGIVVMAGGGDPAASAPRRQVPAVSTTPCTAAAWPYRPAACLGESDRPAPRVIGGGSSLRVAER